MADMVNHPSHYNQNGVETIDIIEWNICYDTGDSMIGFYLGNIIKYLDRHEFKNGEEDLQKAQWYARKLIDDYHTTWSNDFVEYLYHGKFEDALKDWKDCREKTVKEMEYYQRLGAQKNELSKDL